MPNATARTLEHLTVVCAMSCARDASFTTDKIPSSGSGWYGRLGGTLNILRMELSFPAQVSLWHMARIRHLCEVSEHECHCLEAVPDFGDHLFVSHASSLDHSLPRHHICMKPKFRSIGQFPTKHEQFGHHWLRSRVSRMFANGLRPIDDVICFLSGTGPPYT